MEGYPQVVAGVVRPGRFERPTFCSPMLFTRSGPAFCCFPVRSILSIPPGLLDGVVDGVLNLLGLADNNCLRRRPHTPDFTRSSLFSSSFLAPAYFSRSATDNLANQHSVPPHAGPFARLPAPVRVSPDASHAPRLPALDAHDHAPVPVPGLEWLL